MSLKQNVIANYLGQGWTVLMGVAFIPVYIRFLGLESYGLVGAFALLQAWLSLLDFGLTAAVSREMARFSGGGHEPHSIHALLRTVEIIGVVLALLVTAGIWAASGWLARDWVRVEKLQHDVVAQAFVLMGLVAGMRLLENIYRSGIIGLQRQVVLNAVAGVLATVRAVGAIAVLVWLSASITAFFLWQGIVSLLTILAYAYLVHRSLPRINTPPRFSLDALRGVWRFAAGSVLVTLLGFLLSQSDKLILSSVLTLKQFALYTVAYTLAAAVRQLTQPLDQAVYPGMVQFYQRGDDAGLAALYHKATQYSAVIMGGSGIFLAVFGEHVVTLWMRDRGVASSIYPILWILVLGMLLNAVMNGPYYLQMAAGWTGLLVRVNLVMVLVFLPTIYVATKRYEMIGAAVAWATLNLVYVLVVARQMHRRLLRGELREWYFRDLLLPLSVAGAIALGARALGPAPSGGVANAFFLAVVLPCVLLGAALAAARVRRALTAQVSMLLKR